MGSSQKMASISKLKLLRLDGDGEKKNPNISIISEESVH